MTQVEARGMIAAGIPKSHSSTWLDLGAGTGVFTEALATLLGSDGTVYAIDKEPEIPKRLIDNKSLAAVKSMQLDFVTDEVAIQEIDGILMANSFHYVKDKKALIERLRKILKPSGRFIFVEYDTLKSNSWVPYPIDFATLQSFMLERGFSSVNKLSERPSVFNNAMMYSSVVM